MKQGKPHLSLSLSLSQIVVTKSHSKLSSGDAHGKFIITHILFASLLGFVAAAATCYYQQRKSKAVTVTVTAVRDQANIPRLERTESGRVGKLERFSHYVGNYAFQFSLSITPI